MKKYRMTIGILGMGLLLANAIVAGELPESTAAGSLHIKAQPLGDALNELAQQSGLQLVFYSSIGEGLLSPDLQGNYDVRAALERLLANTPLTYDFINARTVAIREKSPSSSLLQRSPSDISSHNTASSTPSEALRLAEVTAVETSRSSDKASETSREKNSSKDEQRSRQRDRSANEMVVTGTHIRGSAPIGSPIFVYTQEDFEKVGAATAQQFFATLPQNFGGGRTEDSWSGVPSNGAADSGGGGGSDQTFGSGINLRGLGSGATLVLVDGHRQAVSGYADYIDVSMIPLSAVERIEILPDGASAIYGSDAIGGVVNIIMLRDYQGAQTRLFSGTTTQGGGTEYLGAQTFGIGWGSGNALLTYEYHHRDPISSRQRDFLDLDAQGLPDIDITGEQERHSVMLNLRQTLTDRLSTNGSLTYSTRDAVGSTFDVFALDYFHTTSSNESYGGSWGLNMELTSSWRAELIGVFSHSELKDSDFIYPRFYEQFGLTADQLRSSQYDLRSGELHFGGDAFDLPAGTVRAALGGGYRKESYDVARRTDVLGTSLPDRVGELSAKHAFVEMAIPLIAGEGTSDPRLELSLAGRYEKYSTFGDTTDPKIGLQWKPSKLLKLRASYATSFKVPTLDQADTSRNYIITSNQNDPTTPSGQRRILADFTVDPNLSPETSTSWTAGIDLTPENSGFKAQLTGFDIEYKDRISSVPFANILLILHDPAYAGIRAVRGDIPDAEFDAIVQRALAAQDALVFGCVPAVPPGTPCSEPTSNFNAVVDFGLRNLAGTHERGLDLTLKQRIDGGAGAFNVEFNATYLFDIERQFTANAPERDLVDTTYNPTSLKLRAGAGWNNTQWGITGFINYTGDYTNDLVIPALSMGSFATMDLNVRYETGRRFQGSLLDQISVVLNANNIFDRDPPGLHLSDGSTAWDSANADLYGRVISLTINKTW